VWNGSSPKISHQVRFLGRLAIVADYDLLFLVVETETPHML